MSNTPKNIVILGSTGSIGESALRVVAAFPDRFRIIGLAAQTKVTRLLEQARLFLLNAWPWPIAKRRNTPRNWPRQA